MRCSILGSYHRPILLYIVLLTGINGLNTHAYDLLNVGKMHAKSVCSSVKFLQAR